MKKSIKVSLITLLLAVVMLVSSACAQTSNPASETSEAPVAQTSAAQTEAQTESLYDDQGFLKDEIPADATCGGKMLRMLEWSDASEVEFTVEDTTGDTVLDSIFTRNSRVESRLNVTFEHTAIKGNNDNRNAFLSSAKNSVSNGDNFDIYASYSMTTALLAYNGLCRDITKYEVIDLDKPWWPESLIKEAKINNRLYFVSGDISTNLLYQMYGIFFNKDMIDDLNLSLPYECVKNNTWTFETMFTMAKAAGSDETATERTYGFTTASNVYLDPFFYAAGLRTLEQKSDGTLVVSDSFHSERTEDVASMVWDFLHESCSNYSDSKYSYFVSGSSMFTMTICSFAKNMLTEVGFSYGIAPVPKYNSDVENYSTITGFPYTLYAISTSSENPDEAALALECMGSESYRTITPALFYITMKARYAQDNESSEMFDIIRNTVCFDTGRIFCSSLDKLTYSLFRSNVSASTKTSYLTSFNTNSRSLGKLLEKMNTAFKELEK